MTPEDIAKLPYRPCVGLMVLNGAREVFVGQRIDNRYDAWQMPQGGVDPGETPVQAAMRELGEETGILPEMVSIKAESSKWHPYELPYDLVPKLWNGRFRGQEQKWFLLDFQGSDSDVNIATKHQEFSTWKWMPVDDLLTSIVPFKRDVYSAVIAEFQPHLSA